MPNTPLQRIRQAAADRESFDKDTLPVLPDGFSWSLTRPESIELLRSNRSVASAGKIGDLIIVSARIGGEWISDPADYATRIEAVKALAEIAEELLTE